MDKAFGDKGGGDKIRIDKWLWFARFFKTRTLAGKIADGGKIRVNGDIIKKSSHSVKVGDILTFPTGDSKNPIIRVIEVVALGEKRQSAPQAQLLYTDLSPPQPRIKEKDTFHHRERGTGRPTKKQRRETEKLQDQFGGVLRKDED